MASHYIRAQFYTCTCTCACAYAHAYAHVVHAHVHVHVHVQVQVQVQVQGTRDAKAEFLNYVKAKGVTRRSFGVNDTKWTSALLAKVVK